MALPMLVGGSDCGPSNPLQGLSKQFDQDRGAQQDHFGAGRAGSSRETFRTQQAVALDSDAARFFSAPTDSSPAFNPRTYDVSALRAALPAAIQSPIQPPPATVSAGWASDFMQQRPIHTPPLPLENAGGRSMYHGDDVLDPQIHQKSMMGYEARTQWSTRLVGQVIAPMPSLVRASPIHVQTPVVTNQVSWDKEFSAQELRVAVPSSASLDDIQQNQQILHERPAEGDELAKTAGLLLENVKDEQNPKFQNSEFMGLMKQLRDGRVIVEGNQMVENIGQSTSTTTQLETGAGSPLARSRNVHYDVTQPSTAPVFVRGTLANVNPIYQEGDEEGVILRDDNDAYFRQDNADYTRYWNESTRQIPTGTTAQLPEWEKLQSDWDNFEATSIGIKPVHTYHFQENNPYLVGDSSTTQHHLIHQGARRSMFEVSIPIHQSSVTLSFVTQNILELEAAVQHDMNNASAWFQLGVKQQENERENKAIQALQRARELDPTHLATWLALAVSHTNENNRLGTYDAIKEWVSRNSNYEAAVTNFNSQTPDHPDASITERYTRLIQCLITMARSNVSGEIDADIQIALAVLLNSNEEYEKAQDCFRTALAVRPEDWLLYNRVGATMANSGNAGNALQYYHRALELNPGYIRARFNLGISCINLRRYDEAAQHILDALVLQGNDGVQDSDSLDEIRGVQSSALWASLKTTCLHMQRVDLAALCDREDLEGRSYATEISRPVHLSLLTAFRNQFHN
ncbi:hypothetical protein BDZ94DRAFT_1317018 [Collybia nuda]|uniref:Peroxisomal targeting signal 1 receptor n=1 Tax=Collybia nuda TaxID=64659 RepID=A0A9P5YLB8_9AGAR|nr:hypothetical protein BDZ94DRAFT_1317018 [Collybia nuda]